jgi:hypothetical protein
MARVSLRVALLALAVTTCLYAAPQRALFPTNLHLTRQIQDPLSGSTTTIEEYCSGNRMVAISGDRTVIVDYDKQEITEIDRRKGTWSVSRFSDVASANMEMGSAARSRRVTADATSGPAPEKWKLTPQGQRGAAGRSVEQFEFIDQGEIKRKVDVGVDRSVALTREAVEVLIGAAYPNTVRDEHEAVLRAAVSARPAAARGMAANSETPAEETYGLPLTQSFTYTDSGSELTFRSAITRVGSEVVPAEALMIPPGSKRVESPATAARRQLRELDHPGSTSVPPEN